MTRPTDRPGVCRDCGARNAPGTTRCWLCGSELKWPAPNAEPPVAIDPTELEARSQAYYRVPRLPTKSADFADVELVPDRPEAPPHWYLLMAVLTGLVIVAIAAGLYRDAPGIAILVLLSCMPALLVTVIRMGRHRAAGREVTWTHRVLTFVLTSAALAAIICMAVVVAAVAMFVYFFITCLRSLGNGM